MQLILNSLGQDIFEAVKQPGTGQLLPLVQDMIQNLYEHYGIVTTAGIASVTTQINFKFKSSESFSGDFATFTNTW
jgi:hypothetical protein